MHVTEGTARKSSTVPAQPPASTTLTGTTIKRPAAPLAAAIAVIVAVSPAPGVWPVRSTHDPAPGRRTPSSSCRLTCASRPRDVLGPRVAHGPVERVVRHLFPAVLGEGVVGAVGVLLELGERACLLLDLVGGARRRCGHGVVLAVGEEQQRRAA